MNPRTTALVLSLAFAAVGSALWFGQHRWFGGLSLGAGLALAVYILTRPRR